MLKKIFKYLYNLSTKINYPIKFLRVFYVFFPLIIYSPNLSSNFLTYLYHPLATQQQKNSQTKSMVYFILYFTLNIN